jgi:hypothetical protein
MRRRIPNQKILNRIQMLGLQTRKSRGTTMLFPTHLTWMMMRKVLVLKKVLKDQKVLMTMHPLNR